MQRLSKAFQKSSIFLTIPKQIEELASGNASAATFDFSKWLYFKDMSDAEKSNSADAGAANRQLFNLFGYKASYARGLFYAFFLVIAPLFAGQSALVTLSSEELGTGKSQTEIIENFYDALEKNNDVAMKKILAPKYKISSITEKHHTASSDFDLGSPDIYIRMKAYHQAFPNLSIRIEKLIISGNTAVAEVTITGIQKGVLFGIAPTNRYITIHSIAIFTIENNQIAEIDEMMGEYNLMKQLGYIPI